MALRPINSNRRPGLGVTPRSRKRLRRIRSPLRRRPPSPGRRRRSASSGRSKRQVSDYEDFTGTITAREKVEIRAQATGSVVKVYFHGGASVKPGDLLAEIDPRTYQAEVDKQEANVRLAEARRRSLTAEAARTKKSVEAKIASATDRNEIVGRQAESPGRLAGGPGGLENRQAQPGLHQDFRPQRRCDQSSRVGPGEPSSRPAERTWPRLSHRALYTSCSISMSEPWGD